MVDIKTMVSRHCGIELPSVLAANKTRSKLTFTLLCWGQGTLKFVYIYIYIYIYISIKFKKEWSRLVILDFYVLELFAVLFLNVFLS